MARAPGEAYLSRREIDELMFPSHERAQATSGHYMEASSASGSNQRSKGGQPLPKFLISLPGGNQITAGPSSRPHDTRQVPAMPPQRSVQPSGSQPLAPTVATTLMSQANTQSIPASQPLAQSAYSQPLASVRKGPVSAKMQPPTSVWDGINSGRYIYKPNANAMLRDVSHHNQQPVNSIRAHGLLAPVAPPAPVALATVAPPAPPATIPPPPPPATILRALRPSPNARPMHRWYTKDAGIFRLASAAVTLFRVGRIRKARLIAQFTVDLAKPDTWRKWLEMCLSKLEGPDD